MGAKGLGGETVLGAKRLGCGGETTKGEIGGETTSGGNDEMVWGETSCYLIMYRNGPKRTYKNDDFSGTRNRFQLIPKCTSIGTRKGRVGYNRNKPSMYVCMYVYVCMCVCVCVCVRACVRACVCVCMRAGGHAGRQAPLHYRTVPYRVPYRAVPYPTLPYPTVPVSALLL